MYIYKTLEHKTVGRHKLITSDNVELWACLHRMVKVVTENINNNARAYIGPRTTLVELLRKNRVI